MTTWTAFLIGIGIGTPWLLACILVVLWFRSIPKDESEETGTEAPVHK